MFNWKAAITVIVVGAILFFGLWYATEHPNQVNAPAPVEEGRK